MLIEKAIKAAPASSLRVGYRALIITHRCSTGDLACGVFFEDFVVSGLAFLLMGRVNLLVEIGEGPLGRTNWSGGGRFERKTFDV